MDLTEAAKVQVNKGILIYYFILCKKMLTTLTIGVIITPIMLKGGFDMFVNNSNRTVVHNVMENIKKEIPRPAVTLAY